MIVYVTTNLINGRKYIGKDVRNSPSYLGSGKILKNAIARYGKKNFVKEILAYGNTVNELEDLEKYYIEYYGAQKSDLFYNITSGGNGGVTKDQSSKKKPIYQFELDSKLIKKWISAGDASKHYNISRSKIVSNLDSGCQYKGFLWGRSEIYASKRKLPTYNRKNVIQCDLKGKIVNKFNSVVEACLHNGYNKTTIYAAIKGKIPNHPYMWIINEKE